MVGQRSSKSPVRVRFLTSPQQNTLIMELVLLYSLPGLISFLLMNECYKRGIVDGAFAALPCIIPVVNIIMIFVYIKKLMND